MPDVSVGVIQQFLHPPVQLCRLEFIPGSPFFGGSYTVSRPAGPVGVDAFGIWYSLTLERAGAGFTFGNVRIFDDRVVQLTVDHTMRDGSLVVTQRMEGFAEFDLLMFEEAVPTDVRVTVTQGFGVDLYWVLL